MLLMVAVAKPDEAGALSGMWGGDCGTFSLGLINKKSKKEQGIYIYISCSVFFISSKFTVLVMTSLFSYLRHSNSWLCYFSDRDILGRDK